MNKIHLFFLKARLKYFSRLASKYDFNKILNASGIRVGHHTIFYDPNSMTIDRERPWMLEIGDYCKITRGCVILTHDYSRSVLRRKYGDIVGEAGKTIIGDNVFIGVNSIVLVGTHIGNNVIIGAGSVVSGIIPDNTVYAGNPARKICDLDEFYKKRQAKEIRYAQCYFSEFKKRYNRYPSESESGPFFHLYMERSVDALAKAGISLNWNGDNADEIRECFLKSERMFLDIESILNA